MGKILLVDDDSRVRKTLCIHLRKDGHEIVEAGDGLDGLEKFQESQFDMVICDIRMPKMDGIGLLEKVRELSASIPFLVLSGFMESEIAEEALSKGATDFLTKPIEKAAIVSKVRELVGG